MKETKDVSWDRCECMNVKKGLRIVVLSQSAQVKVT